MTPGELYQAGQLTEALEAAQADVKKHPSDTSRRGLFCEMLCFAGQFDRADQQLDTMGKQDPDSMIGVINFRQLLRAETARQQFFAEGRVPEFLSEPGGTLKKQLEASIAIREGQQDEAARLLQEAEEARVHASGVCDGEPFSDWRDLDDLTAAVFEVLTNTGKYYWIPIERFELIEFRAPERPRDLIWRRAHIVVTDGPDGEVFLPALYPQTGDSDDDQLRLGRGTTWSGDDQSPVRGVGQRMYLVGDDTRSIMQLKQVEFHRK